MNKVSRAGVALLLLGLMFLATGCATVVPNISAGQKFWSDKQHAIGVAVIKLPAAGAHKSGSQGLLDIAINNSMASDLETHLSQQDVTKIENLADKIASYLQEKGFEVKRISDQVDPEAFPEQEASGGGKHYSLRDYSSLKEQHGIEKLVLLSINQIGTIRSYYGFIPTSSPAGYASLNGQVINLTTAELEWNQNAVQQTPSAESEWDVPPDFPGLTQAMEMAFDNSRQVIFNNFIQ